MSHPGKADGYVLIDAIVVVLIVSVAAIIVLSGISTAARTAAKRLEGVLIHVEERTTYEMGLLKDLVDEKKQ